jgi:C_GCAxxG_C_C family probable redox protein
MKKSEIIQSMVARAVEAQMRDDICARSAMVGLRSYFKDIPEEMVTATLSLAGGCGSASGSCGAYCSGLLAVGLKFNPTIEEEQSDPRARDRGALSFMEYRDRFIEVWDTTLCPEIHRQLFGQAFDLIDPIEHVAFLSTPGHEAKCAKVVASAVELAADMLLDKHPRWL